MTKQKFEIQMHKNIYAQSSLFNEYESRREMKSSKVAKSQFKFMSRWKQRICSKDERNFISLDTGLYCKFQ